MKLFKSLTTPSSIIKIGFLSIFCTFTHFTYSVEQTTLKDCFSETFSFTCKNPHEFLKNIGIDINQNIIPVKKLRQTDKTTWGCHKGSFHADEKGVEYFVKTTQMMNEFIGSRLLNEILDTERTPLVKLIDGKENGIASQKLLKFIRANNINIKKKNVIDEIPLAIALDYIGINNRGGKNMGYIVLSDKNIVAARVDVDKSFTFGEDRWKGKNLNSDHLNLSLLHGSVKKYPRDQVVKAIKKVTDIPDEKIVEIVFECWTTLNQVGYPIPLERGIVFGQQLVERKKAFNDILNKLTHNQKTIKSSEPEPSKKVSKEKKIEEKKNRKVKDKSKKKQKASIK